MPAIQAALKDMPLLISCSERHSHASADRRGEIGRKPDIMVELKRDAQMHEILYAECSRLSSPLRKELVDQVKLWRVMNDGMYFLRKSCRPEKGQFGVLGVQVFRKKLRLNVLIRDHYDIHFHYRLIESEIPVQQSDVKTVTEFVRTLLVLRNVLFVNMTLLFDAFNSNDIRSDHIDVQENSSTISSPRPRKKRKR